MVSQSDYGLRLNVRRLSFIKHQWLQVAIWTPEGGSRGYPCIKISLANNPPSPGKVGHTPRVYVPNLFEQWFGFF